MKPKELDCTGMPCPQPVLKCRRCLEDESPARVDILVDNAAAKDNVTRFLSTQGYSVTAERDGANWRLTATAPAGSDTRDSGTAQAAQSPAPDAEARTVVFLTSDRVGRGDDELGAKLMHNFLATLPELGSGLWRLVLVNAAVRLACHGHADLPALQALAENGAEVLVCGTCLDHFGLLENKKIGETTNMLDVVTSLQLADKIIQI